MDNRDSGCRAPARCGSDDVRRAGEVWYLVGVDPTGRAVVLRGSGGNPDRIAVGPETRQAREFGSLVTGNDRPTGSVFQISELALRCDLLLVTCDW